MNKLKILYIWGYNESVTSELFERLKNNLDSKKFELITDYYAQYSPKEAVYDLNYIIKEKKINIIIAHDLGGYLATLLNNNLLKILLDPIYNPSKELLEYDEEVPKHIIKFYEESELKPINFNNTICIFSSDNNYDNYSKLCKSIKSDKFIETINELID